MNLKPADMLKSAVISDEEYQKICPLLADLIRSSKLNVCKEVISQIKKIIKAKSSTPPQKLRALKSLNTLMMVGNVHFLLFTQKKVMSRLAILASHKKEHSIELRAETIFGKDSVSTMENRAASIEFINCLLECIKSWASEFGKAPDRSDSVFFTTYNKLKENGVRFPAKQSSRKEERKSSVSRKNPLLEQSEEILKLLDENSDETMAEEYKQLLRQNKPQIENMLQEAMTNNNSADTEMFLLLIERISAALESKPKLARSSDIPKPSFATGGVNLKPDKGNFDLFDLDIAPAPKSSAFVTHQPIVLDNKSNLFPKNNLMTGNLFPPSSGSMFPSAEKQSPVIENKGAEMKNSLFPQSFEKRTPSPEKAQERSSLFPEEKKEVKPFKLDKFDDQLRLEGDITFAEPKINLFPDSFKEFKVESRQEDPQITKLKLENSQLLEALEMCKALVKERDSVIVRLNQEIEQLKAKNEEANEEAKESLEVIEYLKLKLEKQKAKQKKEQVFEPPPVQKPQEKPSNLDFDLDFILGPKKDQELQSAPQGIPQNIPQGVPQNMPQGMPQNIPQSPQVVQPENLIFYRMGNCMEMGVLYDSESLQVGFQIKRQSSELFCMLFIGNKSPSPFTEVTTELQDVAMEAFPIMMQPLKTTEEVPQNGQTTRMIKAQLSTFTNKVPKILISIKSQGFVSLSLKLPLTIARFLEARQELPSSIWNEWKKLVFEEDTSVVNIAQFSSFPEMCSFLCFGTGFCLYSNNEIQDLGPVEVLAAGQFEDTLVMFLVGLTGNGATAKFSIRCRNNPLRDALSSIIKGQISK